MKTLDEMIAVMEASKTKEIEAAGGWIFRMDVGRTNGEWIISWYPKEDEVQAPKIAQQQEMKLNPSE